jgi:hypothetical protein
MLGSEGIQKGMKRVYPRNQGHERKFCGAEVHIPVRDGCVFVVTDQHYWPFQEKSLAHKASVVLAKKMKPYAIISNGDSLDGASISRWPSSSFDDLGSKPTVKMELDINLERLYDFEQIPSAEWLIWNLGNHDARYESFLSAHVPEFAGVEGFCLKNHFPGWLPAWSTMIGNEVVVKHRFKGGMYAEANNALHSGRNIVTGHLHTLWAKPVTDYNGIRWGIGAGTLADVKSKQFVHYTEANPVNWQSGFAILHFRGGKFTGPELVYALPDGRVLYQGNVLKV